MPFWFPCVLGFRIILGFRITFFGFRIILGCRIIGFGFRIIRFWLQNHPWFQNHSSTSVWTLKEPLFGVFWCFVSLVFFYPNFVYLPWKAQDRLSAELRRLRSLSVRRVEWTLENCQRPQRAKRGILSNRLEFNMNSRSIPGHGDIASEFIGGYRMI